MEEARNRHQLLASSNQQRNKDQDEIMATLAALVGGIFIGYFWAQTEEMLRDRKKREDE